MASLRSQSKIKGWKREVELFYQLAAQFDYTLSTYTEPRKYNSEKILQGPLIDAFTHVGQLALLRHMAGSPIEGESYRIADVKAGQVESDQPLRTRGLED